VSEAPFGRYRLVQLLGRGGMGEVWRAHDTVIDRMVAIKMLLPNFAQDEKFDQRFRREARAAARLDNPHVVPIYDVGEIDGRLYVTMRLINGQDLQTLLDAGPLKPQRAVAIIEQVAKALHAAHKVRLIHRDIKPSNILIDDDDFAYLIDFGIARAAGEAGLTSTGTTIGTWSYMAPERFSTGQAEASSDIYALACVLYQCLTGEPPFPGTALEQIVAAHLVNPPPRTSTQRPGIPTSMDDVVATGMAKTPDQRYRTARELAQAARAALTTPVRPAAPGASLLTTQVAAASPPRKAAAEPRSERRQAFSPTKGSWAKVVADGDDHYREIGKIIEVFDEEDEDGFEVIVEFRGDPHGYAFQRDELVAVAPPAERQPAPSAPSRGEDFWLDVGIDPIRIITAGADLLTLRCYLGDEPVFLGNNGMIHVFRSKRVFRRFLASASNTDMSSLSTYRDVITAAIEGSLPLEVTEDNVYVLKGLADDIANGPDQIDRDQLELAIELLDDVGKYVGNTVVDDFLQRGQAFGDLAESVFGRTFGFNPGRSRGDALSQWAQLEDFLESRLRVK
jgi:hypothetical protein